MTESRKFELIFWPPVRKLSPVPSFGFVPRLMDWKEAAEAEARSQKPEARIPKPRITRITRIMDFILRVVEGDAVGVERGAAGRSGGVQGFYLHDDGRRPGAIVRARGRIQHAPAHLAVGAEQIIP